MELIDSSIILNNLEAIQLRDSLNLSMSSWNLQNLSVPFTNGEVKKNEKNDSNYLNLVYETPQNFKGERGKNP